MMIRRRIFALVLACAAVIFGGSALTVPKKPDLSATGAKNTAPTGSSVAHSQAPIPTRSGTVAGEGASVVKVIDGDTIQVSIEGRKETVRLIGIDTPETVDPRRPVQCFGREASDKTKELLLAGAAVTLEPDPSQGNTDRYGRLLRYVFLPDGTNVNKYLVDAGYAFEYTYRSNPYRYQKEFLDAQKRAREQKRGLWSDTACIQGTPLPSGI